MKNDLFFGKRKEDFIVNGNAKEDMERIFRIGDALHTYYESAYESAYPLDFNYEEWLASFPPTVASELRKKGVDYCKIIYPLIKQMNESKDMQIDEWMKEHLSEEDYNYYKKNINSTTFS